MDQIQDAVAADAQTLCGRFHADGGTQFPLERLHGFSTHQAHRTAAPPCRKQTAFQNALLDQLGDGAMAEAKHFGRQRLGNPGPAAECRPLLGRLKQADLAAQMPARVMLQKILPQGIGRRGIPHLFQVGGLAQEQAKTPAYARGRGAVLVDLLERIEECLQSPRPFGEDFGSGQPDNAIAKMRGSDLHAF